MINEDASYFRVRAETDVEMAQLATHPAAVQAHYDLSAAYLELAFGVVDHVGRAAAH